MENHGEEGEDYSGLAGAGGTLDQRDGLFLERRLEGGELAVCSCVEGGGSGNVSERRGKRETERVGGKENGAAVESWSPLRLRRRLCSEKPHVFFVIKEHVHNLLSKILSSAHGDGRGRGGDLAGRGPKTKNQKKSSGRAGRHLSPL